MNNLAPSFTRRRALRVAKGRPAIRTLTSQYNGQGMTTPTVAPDPILDLHVARLWARSSADRAMAYGQIRQTVVSPVVLP